MSSSDKIKVPDCLNAFQSFPNPGSATQCLFLRTTSKNHDTNNYATYKPRYASNKLRRFVHLV